MIKQSLLLPIVSLLQILALLFLGRVIWCSCGEFRVWIGDVVSSHLSQHLLDPYSFSHLEHGLIFYWILRYLGKPSIVIAAIIEVFWEILENSPFVIDRYRTATAALGYTGDSIVNSLGDLISCLAGFLIAKSLADKWTLSLFIAIELVMLVVIRDNLTLNIVMLLYPIPAIKEWQLSI